MPAFHLSLLVLLLFAWSKDGITAFQPTLMGVSRASFSQSTSLSAMPTRMNDDKVSATTHISRRSLFQSVFSAGAAVGAMVTTATTTTPQPAYAIAQVPLEELLYNILRVKEATQQEARLIKSGKFKDVQRANIKLAVKFMIENYRLSDSFNRASAYLGSNDKRVAAVDVGQSAVQNLYTILEYFDSADVQNLKVKLFGPQNYGPF